MKELFTEPTLNRGKEGASADRKEQWGNLEVQFLSAPPPLPLLAGGGAQCGAKSVYLRERRNEAGDADQAGVRKQLGHLGDTADIFFSVSGRESKVFVKAMTDIVPI